MAGARTLTGSGSGVLPAASPFSVTAAPGWSASTAIEPEAVERLGREELAQPAEHHLVRISLSCGSDSARRAPASPRFDRCAAARGSRRRAATRRRATLRWPELLADGADAHRLAAALGDLAVDARQLAPRLRQVDDVERGRLAEQARQPQSDVRARRVRRRDTRARRRCACPPRARRRRTTRPRR